jgi:hypothetical protein
MFSSRWQGGGALLAQFRRTGHTPTWAAAAAAAALGAGAVALGGPSAEAEAMPGGAEQEAAAARWQRVVESASPAIVSLRVCAP